MLLDVEQRQPGALLIEVANGIAGARLRAPRRAAFGNEKGVVGCIADDAVAGQPVGQVGDRVEGEQWMVRQAVLDRDRRRIPVGGGKGWLIQPKRPRLTLGVRTGQPARHAVILKADHRLDQLTLLVRPTILTNVKAMFLPPGSSRRRRIATQVAT